MTTAELLFFDGAADALPIYETIRAWAMTAYPETVIRVQKTQISFGRPGLYLVVSHPRKKADRGSLLVTFSLPEAEHSERIFARTQISARRWTHHVLLRTPRDFDGQVQMWIDQSAQMTK